MSSGDHLVYELSMETEGTKEPFVRQDWISILDNQATNYNTYQSVIDTSQLSNSDKWMNYREGFIVMPLLLTVQGDSDVDGVFAMQPADNEFAVDEAVGLKNWFGTMVHSLSVDLNGTTIIQQTQFINIINSFRLMTSLSWGDVQTMGSTIGFYPDSSDTWSYSQYPAAIGQGFCNNGTIAVQTHKSLPGSHRVLL
jgi:hypothetical protein